MSEKKLLIDTTTLRLTLSENADGAMLTARGEFGKADVPTENKRIYPRKIWEREIRKSAQAILEGKNMGELDHPADGKTSLKRVSHIITKLEMTEDGQIIGEAKILDNPDGDRLKSILKAGGSVGVSSRGLGSTAMNEDGYDVVQEDFQYITHDFVADPAVRTSYPQFSNEDRNNENKAAVAEATAKPESKEIVMEQEGKKVEAAATIAAAATEVKLTLEDITKAVAAKEAELTEKFSKDLVVKIAESQDKVREEVKAQLLADSDISKTKLALESVKNAVREFVMPADIDASIKAKDAEIAQLKESVQKAEAKLAEAEVKAGKIVESARSLTIGLHYEKTLAESTDRDSIKSIIGDASKFKDTKSLDEAIQGAKKVLSKKLEEQKAKDAEKASLKAEYEKTIGEMKTQLDNLTSALDESMELAKDYALKLYVESKVKGNPNAEKIRSICEGKGSKEEIDTVIKQFSVAANNGGDYNSVRARFDKARNANLVEDHVKDTSSRKPQGGVVEEGVDAEIAELMPIREVRNLV